MHAPDACKNCGHLLPPLGTENGGQPAACIYCLAEFLCGGDGDATDWKGGDTRMPEGVFGSIGPYRLVGKIGQGAQATVYEAEDPRLGRHLALKVRPQSTEPGSERAMKRFQREAEAASRLEHPGICRIYEIGEESENQYIAMQLVRGELLHTKIASATQSGNLHLGSDPEPGSEPQLTTAATHSSRRGVVRVVELIEKAALALHVAHEAGILHRDIKPGNIMVNEDGEPVLLDFGLARLPESEHTTLTRPGEFMGTPAYMSPEQIAASRIPLDRRSDIYSLGATLYECLTLRRPLDAPNRQSLYHKILTKDPIDPRRLNPSISRDLKVVLQTAMQKDRDLRYASALDLAEDLRRVRAREPIRARPASLPKRATRWCLRHPWQAALVAVVIAAAAAIGGIQIRQEMARDRVICVLGACMEIMSAADQGRDPDPGAMELAGAFLTLRTLEDIRNEPCSPAARERLLAEVTARVRSSTDDYRLVSPRATQVGLRPAFVVQVDEGAKPTRKYEIVVFDPELQKLATIELSDDDIDEDGVLLAELPAEIKLQPVRGEDRAYRWRLEVTDFIGGVSKIPDARVRFNVMTAERRDEIRASVEPTGTEALDAILRAHALLAHGLAAAARAELQRDGEDAPVELQKRRSFLLARALAELGEKDAAAAILTPPER